MPETAARRPARHGRRISFRRFFSFRKGSASLDFATCRTAGFCGLSKRFSRVA
jgi:hypothetical protein